MIVIKPGKRLLTFGVLSFFCVNALFSEVLKNVSSANTASLPAKKTSKRHLRHKNKKIKYKLDQNSAGSQENVTDQQEVSQQADQSKVKSR